MEFISDKHIKMNVSSTLACFVHMTEERLEQVERDYRELLVSSRELEQALEAEIQRLKDTIGELEKSNNEMQLRMREMEVELETFDEEKRRHQGTENILRERLALIEGCAGGGGDCRSTVSERAEIPGGGCSCACHQGKLGSCHVAAASNELVAPSVDVGAPGFGSSVTAARQLLSDISRLKDELKHPS